MRMYDEPIEVRRGLVAGQEAPEQFIWRDRLWVVRDIISHWVETGAWWEQAGIAALLGVGADSTNSAKSANGSARTTITESAAGAGSRDDSIRLGADLLGERDVWRVEAGRGRSRLNHTSSDSDSDSDSDSGSDSGWGVFDLAFDWAEARWQLIRCMD